MSSADTGSASVGSPAPHVPARRGWIDVTLRLATSWVGLLTAYMVAVILALTKYGQLTKGLQDAGIPPRLGLAFVGAFPLFALVFSTIPTLIEQRKILHYSEITGRIQTGYFTLRPRENEEGFERADNAHEEILRWIENTKEPVLYLTGASGTGKSSLLSAWVIPKLEREKHVVIQLRGYEDDHLARIEDKLLQPGVIWERGPSKTDNLRALLNRVTQRLGERRILIVVDQFEEFLILKDRDRQRVLQQFLSDIPISGLTVLLVFRPEYEGLIQDQAWPKLQLDTNRRVISPFSENAAQEFMRKSGLVVDPHIMRAVFREAAEIEQTVGLIRPVTINLCGLVLGRFYSGLPRRFRGGLIRGFLRESLLLPEVRDVAGKLIPQLISDNVTKRPRAVADLAQATQISPSAVRACLRRLGESDRAIVRPLDQQQEVWEISHDFLVPLLDSTVARGTVSFWRRFRPWLPWTATAVMGIAAAAIPLMKPGKLLIASRANIKEYSTRADWSAASSGVTLIDFEGLAPDKGSLPVQMEDSSVGLTLKGVTFEIYRTLGPSKGRLWVIGKDSYYPTHSVLSLQGYSPRTDTLRIKMPIGVTALAMDYGNISTDSGYTFILSTGDIFSISSVPTTGLRFFGVTSDVAITELNIHVSAGGDAKNFTNFSFGTAKQARTH